MSNFRKFISISAVAILGATNLVTPLSYANAATGYDALTGSDLENSSMNFTMPDKDVYLYARAVANIYHVHFNGNGNTSGSMNDQDFEYDEEQALNPNRFERLGHTFNKWTTKSDGSGSGYSNGQTVSNLTGKDDATVNIYAQWDPNEYNISYNLNPGTGTTQPTHTGSHPASATYGVAFTVDNPDRVGYIFSGWNITGMDTNPHTVGGKPSRAATENNVMGTGFNNLTATGGATVYFAAKWNPKDVLYTVHHKRQDLNGDYPADLTVTTTGEGPADSKITPAVNEYSGFIIPSTKTEDINPNGSTIIEYEYERDHFNLTLNAGRGVASASATGTKNTAGGTVLSGGSETVSFLFEEPVELSYVLKNGYGTGTWTGSDANTDSFDMPADNISRTVYAIPTEYEVEYNYRIQDGEGTNTEDIANNPKTYTVESGFTVINPERKHSQFNGWTGTGLSGKVMILTVNTGNTGKRTYYATWICDGGYHGEPTSGEDSFACITDKDTPYYVRYQRPKLEGGYDKDIYTGHGETNTTTGIVIRTYEGFTVDPDHATDVFINADGTGKQDIFYSRDSYNINIDQVSGVNNVTFTTAHNTTSGKALYEDIVTINGDEVPGYTFDHREVKDLNDSPVQVTNSGSIDGATFNMPASSVTITPIFTRDTYTITMILHNGTGTYPSTYTVESPDIPLPTPTRDRGSVFSGWIGGVNGEITEPTKPITITGGSVGNRTYEAVWDCRPGYHDVDGTSCVANTYHIDIPNMNGTGHGAAEDIVFTYDETETLPEAPSQSGYDFVGWIVTGMSGGVEHHIGNIVVTDDTYEYSGTSLEFMNLTVENGGIVTLTAIWSPRNDTKYIVHHYVEDLTGGTYTEISGTGVEYTGTTDTNAIFNRLTGEFEGFTYSGGFVNVSNPRNRPAGAGVTSGNIEKDGSLQIYLYYDRNEWTVYLSGQNVTLTGDGQYKYGANVTVTATPKEGYHFIEWKKKKDDTFTTDL